MESIRSPQDIIDQFRRGEIDISECWDILKHWRPRRGFIQGKLPDPPTKTHVYLPLSQAEKGAIEKLQQVSFGANGGGRRFVRQIRDAVELTQPQKDYLIILVMRYRRH